MSGTGDDPASRAVRPAPPQRPPKPDRPRAVTSSSGAPPPGAEEDDITLRVRLEEEGAVLLAPSPDVAEVPPPPPPLPSTPSAVEHAPLVALEVPASPDADPRRPTRVRYARLGVAIFAAGVLVGVVGSAAVIMNRDVRVADAAASVAPTGVAKPAALPSDAPKPAPVAPPKALEVERRVERSEPARDAVVIPVSSSTAPSCDELLGDGVAKRADPKAAFKETRLANRELVLGNVPKAQTAYCRAFALDRKNVDRHINLGRFYLFHRDWEKAAEYGQSALGLDPRSRRALGVVGDAWAALDKPDEARSAWLAAEKKTSANRRELSLMVRRNFALAKQVERKRDFSLAERLYRRVLLLDPKHVGAIKGVASCLLKVGDYHGAEAWARRADMLKRSK